MIWVIAWLVAGYLSAIASVFVFKAVEENLDRWTPKELLIIIGLGLAGFITTLFTIILIGFVAKEKFMEAWNDDNSWLNTEYKFKKNEDDKKGNG